MKPQMKREHVIEALIGFVMRKIQKGFENEANSYLVDTLLHGVKGYEDMTDGELEEEYTDSFRLPCEIVG